MRESSSTFCFLILGKVVCFVAPFERIFPDLWDVISCCLLFVICCLLFVVCCFLVVVCCLLFVVCCV